MKNIDVLDLNLNALIVFALFLIVFLLIYIAFYKDTGSKHSKKSR